MERPGILNPSHQFSWGFSVSKERSHVAVVGTHTTENKPKTSFCRISNQPPSPSIVYNTISNREDYESNFIREYPPQWTGFNTSSCSSISSLSATCLLPGDAIISINGVSVAPFESTAAVASFIRQNFNDKLLIVALRHDFVWKVGSEEITTKAKSSLDRNHQQLQLYSFNHEHWAGDQRRVAKSIKEAWKIVRSLNGSATAFQTTPTKTNTQSSYSSNISNKVESSTELDVYSLKDTRRLFNEEFDNNSFDPDDGKRICLFVAKDAESSFEEWLKKRKVKWRKHRIGHNLLDDTISMQMYEPSQDFWIARGYETFDRWLLASKTKWRRNYSWNRDKRTRLQSETEKEVHFPAASSVSSAVIDDLSYAQFQDWLVVRKQQWRVSKRKRQRKRVVSESTSSCGPDEATSRQIDISLKNTAAFDHDKIRVLLALNNDTIVIDELLEDQERRATHYLADGPPLDITWIFDAELGCPDDVVVLLMRFLAPPDHGNLLCLSWGSNFSFKKRDLLWQRLCPKQWVLPRRPRKSWCVVYISKIRAEEEASRKQSDDLLMKADAVIEKGDLLTKLEKFVEKAERDFAFDVNYTSGTVLERNSILNMAVINGRKNIVKWLVEEKKADIETCDRGEFTPLINAAWNGDKHLVRFLLGKGSNRRQMGNFHSSKGLSSNHFEGMNAEGWARYRGHNDVADLICIGL